MMYDANKTKEKGIIVGNPEKLIFIFIRFIGVVCSMENATRFNVLGYMY